MEDETETPQPPKPKGKGGRPKGVKNRPKWLLDALKKEPKRPRGRPPGAKNKPKTIEGLIAQALEPPKPRPKRPKKTTHNYETHFARLKREDPEKLREISTRASKRAVSKGRNQPPGRHPHMTLRELARIKEDARILARRIYKIMENEGSLPENPIAREAMKRALEMLAEDNSSKDKISLIRTLLEYNLAKPASTQNLNVKTAEDFLDELAIDT